jgi:hypothetical protein
MNENPYTSLKDIRDRANIVADDMLEACEKHAELLKSNPSKFNFEACDKFSDLMNVYGKDIDMLLKAFEHKLKNEQ